MSTACQRCSFINHSPSADCEMCGNFLAPVAQRVGQVFEDFAPPPFDEAAHRAAAEALSPSDSSNALSLSPSAPPLSTNPSAPSLGDSALSYFPKFLEGSFSSSPRPPVLSSSVPGPASAPSKPQPQLSYNALTPVPIKQGIQEVNGDKDCINELTGHAPGSYLALNTDIDRCDQDFVFKLFIVDQAKQIRKFFVSGFSQDSPSKISISLYNEKGINNNAPIITENQKWVARENQISNTKHTQKFFTEQFLVTDSSQSPTGKHIFEHRPAFLKIFNAAVQHAHSNC